MKRRLTSFSLMRKISLYKSLNQIIRGPLLFTSVSRYLSNCMLQNTPHPCLPLELNKSSIQFLPICQILCGDLENAEALLKKMK